MLQRLIRNGKEAARRTSFPLRRLASRVIGRNAVRGLLRKEQSAFLIELFGRAMWNVDVAREEADGVYLAGWAVTATRSTLALRVNGLMVTNAEFGQTRSDLAAVYPYLSNAGESGFSARVTSSQVRGDELIVELCESESPIGEVPPFYAIRRTDRLPVPDSTRIRRVHGDANVDAFLLVGYDVFRKLEEALRSVTGSGFVAGLRILDWGCGSGRIARWFALRPGVQLVGVDVDGDNVAWCAANLPHGDFHSIPLHPPTHLPDASVDVAFGVSVFTHLTEQVQFEWLRELKRIVRPGGCVLVSVHAMAAVAQQSAWRMAQLARWEQRGFIDGESRDLDGYLPEAGYYRTTLHHPDYIRREWTKVFPSIEIIEGYLGNQALCVLRR